MAYQEVTTTGYGTRVKNAFGGIFTGFIMFIAGTCLLWWNEGRTVKTNDMLNEAQSVTVEMENINKVDAEFNGKMVHATGDAITEDVLKDDAYPVGGNFTRLRRTVEYYQYVENKKEQKRDKLGGGEETITTYTYERKWVDEPVNSSAFHDPQYQGVNRVLIQVEDQEYVAENVNFGAYKIPNFFKSSIGSWSAAPLEGEEDVTAAEQDTTTKQLSAADSIALLQEALIAAQQANRAPATRAEDYQKSGNIVYYGRNMSSPQIGDVRITFEKVDPKNAVSILAKVNGDTFSQFVAKNGYKLATLSNGTLTAEEMYQSEHDANDMMKWICRLVGILLIYAGLKGIFNFLVIILKVIPFLASIMNFGVSLVCGVIAIVWSLIVIAIAWIFYRPVLGITLLVIAGAILAYFVVKGRNKQPELQPQGAPQGGFPQQPQPQQPQPQQPIQPQGQQFASRPQQQPYQGQPQQPQYPQQGGYPQQQGGFPQQGQRPQQPYQGQPQQPQYPQQGQPQQPQYPQQGQPQYPQYPQQGQPQNPNEPRR